ncbi:MAG: NUMOD4 domain-containing protein [Peptostreptococcaceae bacterium]
MNNIGEIWRDVAGYEGLYEVSNFGNVRSLDRIREDKLGKRYRLKGRVLSLTNTSTGYFKVELTDLERKIKSFKVHRLVASSFIENEFNKPFVNHIDGNPKNNNVINLEWCTQSENVKHALNIGLKRIKHEFSKELLENMYVDNKMSIGEISRKLSVDNTTIHRLLKKNGIKTRGYSESKREYGLNVEFILNELKTKTQKQIASEIGCDASLISKYKNNKIKGEI